MSQYFGKSEPYELATLWDVPCIRCGANSQCQWMSCANNGRYMPLCLHCDIALNRLVLQFLNIDPIEFIAAYEDRLIAEGKMDASERCNTTEN